MRAYGISGYQRDASLNWLEVPQPAAGPGEVLVRIRSTALNPLDLKIARGELKQLFGYSLPQPLGQEFAGDIIAVGEGVTGFKPGDAVFARPGMQAIGAFAEQIAVPAADVAPLPAGLSYAEAASLPLVLLTAIQAFTEQVQLKPGDRVFIQGGSGGLGSVAIQVAKHFGAHVATTVSTRNVELVKQLGADQVIDYRAERYDEQLRDYDVVLDTLGGAETQRAMRVLRPGGTLVSVSGAPDGSVAQVAKKPLLRPLLQLLSLRERRAAKRLGVNYRFLFMTENGRQLCDFSEALSSGAIKPVIGHTFSFEQLPEAFALLASGKSNPGKIVIEVA